MPLIFFLQLQISVFDKDNNHLNEAMLQALKLLNEIYFTLLNLVSFFSPLKQNVNNNIEYNDTTIKSLWQS